MYGPSIERLTEEEASQIAQFIVSLESMVDFYQIISTIRPPPSRSPRERPADARR